MGFRHFHVFHSGPHVTYTRKVVLSGYMWEAGVAWTDVRDSVECHSASVITFLYAVKGNGVPCIGSHVVVCVESAASSAFFA